MQIDTTQFPLVFLREHEHNEHHASNADLRALQELLDRNERFVLLTEHLSMDHPEQDHQDRKQQTLFFKQNKARIRDLCRGMIVATADNNVPAPLRLVVQGIGKAFGVPAAFVKSELEAREQASKWLGTT